MFGLFRSKRTNIEKWETELLRKVMAKLPEEYSNLLKQIDDCLLKGVIENASDIQGYVAFTFHPSVFKKYDKTSERDYKLTGIKVYDIKSERFLKYEIYVSSGAISGYSLSNLKKCDIDLNKIEVSDFYKKTIGDSDYNCILDLLDTAESELISPSQVYSVFVGTTKYFHIKDLEDGDFIGMDENKRIYKITHDPLEVVKLDKSLIDILG